MSYKLFINDFECELPPNFSIAQTKQSNDIANITTRNSNFTQNIKLPITAKNTNILAFAGLVGNSSNVPYKRNVCQLIDADTGQHLIYFGWAVLINTDANYNITIYDGSIDFYRVIENINITDCGISDLNHIKNIDNIVGSWTDTDTPYRYIIADYNGKNEFDLKLNIDYQVPSASIKYIWERIFDFIGFEYEGSIFQHEKFTDLWLTFPKPTGEVEPNEILINSQSSSEVGYTAFYYNGNALFEETRYNADVFRENFTDSRAILVNTNQWTSVTSPVPFSVPVQSFIQILESGVYSLNMSFLGSLSFTLTIKNALNEIVVLAQTFTDSVIFNASAGDKVFCSATITTPPNQVQPFGLNDLEIDFSFIDGYAVNFEEIFIDFKVSDFVKEILIHFGVTPYKDKFSNKVEFLTLYELLQGEQIQDFSNKFISKTNEKYTFGNYAKRNLFKYQYNDEGFTHNDGFLQIANENLAEEVTLFQSKIYSPESRKTFIFADEYNVYKIWEKEIKDDETVEYKDLEGRFYFQRSVRKTVPIELISEVTSAEGGNSFYYRESYFRLSFTQILRDWYRPINTIFNNAKMVTAQFWLSPLEFLETDLKKLIYVRQLSSYFLINKINNFIKGKPTQMELIKVDYLTEPTPQIPEVTSPTIAIDDFEINDCEMTLTVITDLPQPTEVQIVPFIYASDVLGNFFWQELFLEPEIFATLDNNEVTFPLEQFPENDYKFLIRKVIPFFAVVESNQTESIEIDGSCYVDNAPSEVTITSVVRMGDVYQFPFSYQRFIINYDFEIPTGITNYNVNVFYFATEFGGYVSGGIFNKSATDPMTIDALLGTVTLTITKIQITILDVYSNEFVL